MARGNAESLERFFASISSDARKELLTGNLNKCGWKSLHCAVREKNISAAQFLVDNGADVNSRDGLGDSPLFTAIVYIYRDNAAKSILTWLLNVDGIDVNATNTSMRLTSLHIAVTRSDELAVAQLLACKNIQSNIADDLGMLPLHYASGFYNSAICCRAVRRHLQANRVGAA